MVLVSFSPEHTNVDAMLVLLLLLKRPLCASEHRDVWKKSGYYKRCRCTKTFKAFFDDIQPHKDWAFYRFVRSPAINRFTCGSFQSGAFVFHIFSLYCPCHWHLNRIKHIIPPPQKKTNKDDSLKQSSYCLCRVLTYQKGTEKNTSVFHRVSKHLSN